jgi:hypothetical protein
LTGGCDVVCDRRLLLSLLHTSNDMKLSMILAGQLFVRYASPVQGTELKVPGAVAPSAQSLNKKI